MENEITQTENTTDSGSQNIDQVYEQAINSRESTVIADKAPTVEQVEEFLIKADGKEIKAKRDEVVKWAEMGYSAPTKIGQLNKQLEQMKKQMGQYQSFEQTYKPVDEFVKQNPDWWQHVQKNWQERESWKNQANQNDPNNPLFQKLSALEQEVQESRKFREELLQKQQEYKTKQEDVALDNQIKSIRDKYPDLDWQASDQEGNTLELRILKHATENGINSFQAAFRDFYHDELLKRAQEKGKVTAANELSKRTKLGVLGESSTPTKQISKGSVKDKSYEDILKETLSELRA